MAVGLGKTRPATLPSEVEFIMRTIFTSLLLVMVGCSSADFTVDNSIALAADTGPSEGGDAGEDVGSTDTGSTDTGSTETADTGLTETSDTGSPDTGPPDTGSTDTGLPETDAAPIEKCKMDEAPVSVPGDAVASPLSFSSAGEKVVVFSVSELDKTATKDLRAEIKFWTSSWVPSTTSFDLEVYRGSKKGLDGKYWVNQCVGSPEAVLQVRGAGALQTFTVIVKDEVSYDEQFFTLWIRPKGSTTSSTVWEVTVTGNK